MLPVWLTPLRLVVIALALITALALARYWHGFAEIHAREAAETEAVAENAARTLVAALAAQTRARFEGVDGALRQLAQLALAQGSVGSEALRFARQSQPAGVILNIVRVDADGYIRESDQGERPNVYVGDRAYFRHHATASTDLPVVVPPLVSRLVTGWTIPVARQLRDRSGRFVGVVAMMLSPEALSAEYRRLDLGPRDLVSLVHADGSYLARSYLLDQALGRKVPAERPYLDAAAADGGVFRAPGGVDGIERVWAWRRLPGLDLVQVVAIDREARLAPMRERHRSEREGVALASAIALTLLAALIYVLLRLDGNLRRLSTSERRFEVALQAASGLAWEWRADGNRVELLGSVTSFLGVPLASASITHAAWRERVHAEDRERVRAAWRGHLAGESASFEAEYRMQGSEGDYRWVLVRGIAEARDGRGRAQRVSGVLIDIDPVKRAQATIARLSARYQQLFDAASEGIYVVDAQGMIEMINPAAQQLLGWRADEAAGHRAHDLFHDPQTGAGDHSWSGCPLHRVLAGGEARPSERLLYWRRDQSAMPVESSIAPLRQNGAIEGAIVVFSDISVHLAAERQLELLATTDELTGISNRRHFVELATRDLRRAAREGLPATLVMVDLDNFKAVNDRYGHAAGDRVLQAFAAECAAQLRDVDVFARLGGDEFALLLTHVDPERAVAVAERIRLAAKANAVGDGIRAVSVTISVGVAHAAPLETLEGLLARADAALYRAKAEGRDRVVLAEAPVDKS